LKFIKENIPETLLITGFIVVSLGVGMISLPAGVITAGICITALSYLLARSAQTSKG
jgi:hypothetical protein